MNCDSEGTRGVPTIRHFPPPGGSTSSGRLEVRFFVEGLPVPAAYIPRGSGRRRIRHPRVTAWAVTIRRELLEALGLIGPPPAPVFGTGPVVLGIRFWLPRPASHWRKGRNAHLLRDAAPRVPTGKPDLENLIKPVKDAVGDFDRRGPILYRDDAQVVGYDPPPYELYADPGQPTGVLVWARPLLELPTPW